MAQSRSVFFGNWVVGNRREGVWRGRRRLGNDQTGTLELMFYRRGHSEQWRDLHLPPPGYSSWFVVFRHPTGRRRWRRGAGFLCFRSLLTPHSHDVCLGIPLWWDPLNSGNLCTLLFPDVVNSLVDLLHCPPKLLLSAGFPWVLYLFATPPLILFQLRPLRWLEASYLLGAPWGDHIHGLLLHSGSAGRVYHCSSQLPAKSHSGPPSALSPSYQHPPAPRGNMQQTSRIWLGGSDVSYF